LSTIRPNFNELLNIFGIIITVVIAYIANNIHRRQLHFQYREEYKKVYYKVMEGISAVSEDGEKGITRDTHNIFHQAWLDSKIFLTKDIEEYTFSLFEKSQTARKLKAKENWLDLDKAINAIKDEKPNDLFKKYLKLD